MKLKKILSVISLIFICNETDAQVKKEGLNFDEDWATMEESFPLFINGNNAKADVGKHILWSSLIIPFSPAIMPSYYFTPGVDNTLNGRSVGWIGNHPIEKAIQILYGLPMRRQGEFYFPPAPVPNSRVLFRNTDSTKLVNKVNGLVQRQNYYTLQITSERAVTEQQIRNRMISDLENCFGLKTSWEKQKKKSIVISRNKFKLSRYIGGFTNLKWGDLLFVNDIPMDEFIATMAASRPFINSGYPIVDETNFNGRLGEISLDATADQPLDFDFLKRGLQKYGLELSIEDRVVDILVISNEPKP